MARRTSNFQTIRSEGGLLPPDLLRRLLDPKGGLPGTQPEDYGLSKGERINEAITQSWNRLNRHWAAFRGAAKGMPEGDALTGLTNDKWSLPLLRELGFGFLPTTHSPTIDGKTYAINRFAGPTPIHLVGCGVSLDRRAAGVRGAAAVNPHGLVQELLNRSPDHLWAIVSNGLRVRVLRDSQALSRQSYLEFDLETMFDGEVYADFVLLWLTAHATRFIPRESGRPDSCVLEQWTKEAQEHGTRALTDLRGGVEKALEILGQGFVSHPKNTALRDALRKGEVKLSDFHGQLLRVVYRLIFLFVAEDRELDGLPLLHPHDVSEASRLACERYASHYSAHRLRELASQIKGSRHGDLWRQFNLLVGALSGDERFAAVRQSLALPALGSLLWDQSSTAALNAPGLAKDGGTELANSDFLDALRLLAFTRQGKVLRPVDYKNLGSEEFGGVYESFLALTPQISSDGARFTFAEFGGNERKTSGSYYTPDSLVQCLLDSALDPVVQERLAGKTGKEAEKALLAIKVCDLAVGSGHFLVGASHRLARHLARIHAQAAGESEPSPLLYQTALRDVIGHCLYGVDINPMAVELCKVTLWLEALEPGKPLSFLDHHIRCGNSLLGATPELIMGGIPNEAYEAIEGDDKEACSALKKKNKRENPKLGEWFIADEAAIRDRLYQAAAAIDEMSDSRPEDIRRKEAAFCAAQSNYDFGKAWDLANLWCAAFVIKKHFSGGACVPVSPEPSFLESSPRQSETTAGQPSTVQASLFGGTEEAPKAKAKKTKAPIRVGSEIPIGITTQHLRDFVEGGALPDGLIVEAKRLADQYRFFHLHLAFPEVFAQGGFDIILGNPPWEKLQLEEEKFFSQIAPDIAAASAKQRKEAIRLLEKNRPDIYIFFRNASRQIAGEAHFAKDSGRFPLSGGGNVSTHSLFIELATTVIAMHARVGLVVPSGLATQDTQKHLFAALTSSGRLATLLDFENRLKLFAGVHPQFRFCLITIGPPRGDSADVEYAFLLQSITDIQQPNRSFRFSYVDLCRFSPNTFSCPQLIDEQEASLLKRIYDAGKVIFQERTMENPWGWQSWQVFNETHEANLLIQGRPDGDQLPLYEGKLFHQFDHRYASYSNFDNVEYLSSLDKEHPERSVNTRYSVPQRIWSERVAHDGYAARWILAFRRITNATNERTSIFCILPMCITGSQSPAVKTSQSAAFVATLLGNLNSLVFDFAARRRVGGTDLNHFIIHQLPVLTPQSVSQPCLFSSGSQLLGDWLLPRVLELTYTAWDLEAFAQDCGWSGPPFRWDEERRFLLRCELDAAFFHLYLGPETEWRQQPAALTQAFPTPRAAVSYILDTFPIVKRRDEAKWGEYRTQRVILEIHDALAEAMQTGKAYQTRLNPAPATIWVAHPPQFDRERVNVKEPGDYILTFVGSLLRHFGGECDVMKLARAYALLLPKRDHFAALAETQFGPAARGWVERFNQAVDARWFLPILRAMDTRNIVSLVEQGDDVMVRLKDPAGPPTNSTLETDVFLVLRVLDLVPDQQISEPVKRMVPKAPRLALREATLVPA